HLHHRPLDEPIQHRRNTRLSYSPVRFRDFHPLHRLRLIGQAIRGFTPIFLSKGQHELVLLPLVAHESRRLLATPINPLRGPFGPSSVTGLLRPLLTSAARSGWIAPSSVRNPGPAADLPR